MFAISTHEGLIIIGIVVLLFGARKLPELGKSIGEGLREFRKSTREVVEDTEQTSENSSAEKTS